jgi:hypothetical protein
MKNIGQETKDKLVNGIRIPIWNGSYETLSSRLRHEIWAELYHKSINQMLTMRNISSVVNSKLTKIQVNFFHTKTDNVSYRVDFKVDTKLSYLRTGRILIRAIGKRIWYKVKAIIL